MLILFKLNDAVDCPMTSLSNLKNILVPSQHATNNETQLKDAMVAADERHVIDDFDDSPEEICDIYAGPTSHPFRKLDADMPGAGELTSSERSSSRILEIRSRQRACSDIGEKVRENADMLSNIASQADCMKAYLEKTELDLSHMEELESKLARLSSKSVELANKTKEMKATISEQKKQLSSLETQRIADRDTMDEMNSEIARVLDKNAAHETSIDDLNAALAELQNEKLGLLERIDAHNAERGRYQAECSDVKAELREAQEMIQHRDMEIAQKELVMADLNELNELNTVCIADAEVRCVALESNNMDLKARISQNLVEIESARRDFEERLRLKDMRVVEFESKFGIRPQKSASGNGAETDFTDSQLVAKKNDADGAAKKLKDFSELVDKKARKSGQTGREKRVA